MAAEIFRSQTTPIVRTKAYERGDRYSSRKACERLGISAAARALHIDRSIRLSRSTADPAVGVLRSLGSTERWPILRLALLVEI